MTGTVERIIEPRRRPVGAGEVDRLLPFRLRRMVGPFVYADLIGPDELDPGTGVDVPVHPHIGLSTVTYLFDGAMVHRDSTGAVQRIEPGAVNWMTAGAGVAHSERSPDDARPVTSAIAGLQTWVALPDELESADPWFEHLPADDVPSVDEDDAAVRVLVGDHGAATSPVTGSSSMFHTSVELAAGGRWRLHDQHVERAVLVVDTDDPSGVVRVGDVDVPPRHLAVVDPGAVVDVSCSGRTHLMAFGGDPLGPRHIRWNFVASRTELIDTAADRWRAGDWPEVVGDAERVPMP